MIVGAQNRRTHPLSPVRLMMVYYYFEGFILSANAMNAEPSVAAKQVELHLGVLENTVYRWRERKCLPAHKTGLLWKFQFLKVDEWARTGATDENSVPNNVSHTPAPEAGKA